MDKSGNKKLTAELCVDIAKALNKVYVKYDRRCAGFAVKARVEFLKLEMNYEDCIQYVPDEESE